MQKLKKFFDFLIILIISIPSFLSLLNSSFFSMHDNQHIARLFLLDKGINQGYFYPRWVDLLGFNFGYPLFNFYPPLVYYIGELFHLVGFSLIWSIKLTFILGFVISAYGIFLLAKKFISRNFAYLASIFYTYFFYHGVLIYVRGALSEFFSLAIIPYLFLGIENLRDKPNLKNSVLLGIVIALLIITHPLIAFPTLIYIGFFFIFYLLLYSFKRIKWLGYSMLSGMLGLAFSAFYWLPSMLERKFTLVEKILTKELASFDVHFICIQQFFTSNWGYGGSISGCSDGMTFQIGKSHIIALVLSVFSVGLFILQRHFRPPYRHSRPDRESADPRIREDDDKTKLKYYFFFLFLTLFSLFMTTDYSLFIWKNVAYLSYLQFPWRFLTFTSLFISLTSAYGIYLLLISLEKIKNRKVLMSLFVLVYGVLTIYFVGRYFVPQNYINKSDRQLTSFDEVAWRVSRSTFEFAPKGIKTTKSNLNTTIPNIRIIDIDDTSYEVVDGKAQVISIKNKFMEKEYLVKAEEDIIFRQNTFNFPGWTAYQNGKKIDISDNNDFKLITVKLPKGEHNLSFIFEDTLVRKIGNYLSIASISSIFIFYLLFKLKKIKS